MTEPMADKTICQVVVPAPAVGVEVPSGQLCEGEQGRQADSDVWPKERNQLRHAESAGNSRLGCMQLHD